MLVPTLSDMIYLYTRSNRGVRTFRHTYEQRKQRT